MVDNGNIQNYHMRSIFMSKRKYSKEFKLKVLAEHQEGASFYSLEKKYNIVLGTVKRWNAAFLAHGEEALDYHNSNLCTYSAEFKQRVVSDYLSGGGSFGSLAVKYGIHAESTVLKWVKQYNSHEELTDSRKVGGYLMTKDIRSRKTTFEERITIVEYCVAHSNDYSGTAKEFNCSYGQVYSWVKKYIKKGIDGLKDGRGHNKPVDDMSELERLRAENRLLKAEQKRQQMEIDLLKKLEEIERR